MWNGVLLFQQPLHNHHARLLQLCKVANTLHKLPQPCDNLTMLQQGFYNLVISVWIKMRASHCTPSLSHTPQLEQSITVLFLPLLAMHCWPLLQIQNFFSSDCSGWSVTAELRLIEVNITFICNFKLCWTNTSIMISNPLTIITGLKNYLNTLWKHDQF